MKVPASDHFRYRDGQLFADDVDLREVADAASTPTYVYSARAIDSAFRAVNDALADVPHMVAYAVKANSNLAILGRLAASGCGADIVSAGELTRALRAGFPADRIVFSGVGKSDAEIEAALGEKVLSLHAESEQEVFAIERIAARLGVQASIALRVNPDVDAQTHPYISTGMHSTKFGLELGVARRILPAILKSEHLRLEGLACHIGSMVLSPEPLGEAVERTAAFAVECHRAGARLSALDAGGGWPILYGDEERNAESHRVFGRTLIDAMERGGALDLGLKLIIEPGRSIVGDAGILLVRVLYTKEQAGKRFVITDGAMTELIRPPLYDAYHAIVPVKQPDGEQAGTLADVVGPVCESTDFLAKDRLLPPIQRGDLLAVRGAGAYCAVMGSTYNSRLLAPEVLVEGERFRTVRARQDLEHLLALERP